MTRRSLSPARRSNYRIIKPVSCTFALLLVYCGLSVPQAAVPSFAAKVDHPAGTNPRSVAVGDSNLDSKPALAVANETSNTVSVLLNNGDDTMCKAIQKQLDGLRETLSLLTKEKDQPGQTAAERGRLTQEVKQLLQQIGATERALTQCQQDAASQPFLPRPTGAAPQRILEINYSNPRPNFDPANPKWAGQLVNGPSFDPTLTKDGTDYKNPKKYPEYVPREWTQVLAPAEDYEKFALVGASGWVFAPGFSSADIPFSHPFGFDWEYAMALDKPKVGPAPFDFLLAAGNKATEKDPDQPTTDEGGEEKDARGLGLSVPKGLLAVEMDGNNVPNAFAQQVKQGHRIVTFGRWIVDGGHTPFHTEIHPPLLMAAAGTTQDSTRVLFTSRPYLVSQVYTTDQNTIYNDAAGDDGTFFGHMVNELVKVVDPPIVFIPRSIKVEAHPKVKDHPFRGAYLLHLVIRPPTPANPLGQTQQLSVSFHFTVRNGCAVQVISSAPDTIDVFISLNDLGYHPPPLPAKSEQDWSRDELDTLSKGAGTQILDTEALAAGAALIKGGPIGAAATALILGRGIQTDTYAPVSGGVDILNTVNAVRDVPANNIPAGKGVTQNDNQPFPVTGWLEVKWVRPNAVIRP